MATKYTELNELVLNRQIKHESQAQEYCSECGKHRDIIDKYGCFGSLTPAKRPQGCIAI